MKTVLFYSYKGGQGRTTAVANVGACLYRLGKSVVMLDLDVECPGLPLKFDISVSDDRSIVSEKGGIVDYILDSVKAFKCTTEALQRRVVPLASGGGVGHLGSLSLIATGPMNSRYFEFLQSQNWTFLAKRGPLVPKRLRYLDELHTAIEGLDPRPDYLLVDLSSGLTDLGTAIMTAWAAPIVVFFSLDRENLDGTSFVMKEVDKVPAYVDELRRSPIEKISLFPVLSRVSAFVTGTSEIDVRMEAAKGLFDDKNRYQSVRLVRSDPELEQRWFLHFPLEGKIPNVRLARDYLEVVAAIFPELVEGPFPVQSLIARLELGEEVAEQYKIFAMPGGQGVMINLSDHERNVSFKVKTFLSMIEDIHSGRIAERLASDRPIDSPFLQDTSEAETAALKDRGLFEAGQQCGKSFGQSLVRDVWDEIGRQRDLRLRVLEWCKFDSTIGFGLLTCGDVMDNGKLRGSIEVGHNFLASGRSDREPRLCTLLAGYIAGVLQVIAANDRIQVEHHVKDCMQMNHQLNTCKFRFYER